MNDRKRASRAARIWQAAAMALAVATIAAAGGCSSTGTPKGASTSAAASGGAFTTVAELLQLGIRQAEQKNWSAASATFNDVLAIAPRNVYALYNLGLIDQSRGDTTDADREYDKALGDDAAYTPALYNLAITLERSDPGRALSLYKKIISINPQASTAYLRMAFLYARQNKLNQAVAARAKAIAIDPSLGKYPLPVKH